MRSTTMHLVLILLMVSVTSAHQEKGDNDPDGKEVLIRSLKEEDVKEHLPLSEDDFYRNIDVRDNSGCTFPFQVVGGNCYFFSTESKNYYESISYCETLAHGHSFDSTIAMLGYDEAEDEAVLGEAVKQGKTFWVGGKTEDNVHWKWADGRDMNLQDPFWYYTEPNAAENKCSVAQVTSSGNNVRSYLYDFDCSDTLSFICQTSFHFEFREIGNNFYFFSEEQGLPHTSWTNARDYCRSLSVPIGYHSDLAVLGRSDQDSYILMDTFGAITGYANMWLGAFAPTDCEYQWVDGRTLELASHYWLYTEPGCGSSNRVFLEHRTVYNKTYLGDLTDSSLFPFICQLYTD